MTSKLQSIIIKLAKLQVFLIEREIDFARRRSFARSLQLRAYFFTQHSNEIMWLKASMS